MADKEVYLGVEIPAPQAVLHKALGGLAGIAVRPGGRRAVQADPGDRRAHGIPGIEATPATPRQLEWLLHRSCSLGLPAPLTLGGRRRRGRGRREDLDEFTDHVQLVRRSPTAAPSGSVGEHDDQRDRAARLRPVGGPDDRPGDPARGPVDAAHRPAAASRSSGRRGSTVEDSAKVGMAMRRNIQKIRAQKDHYELEHARTRARARWTGRPPRPWPSRTRSRWVCPGLSTRTAGWYRIAVSGRLEEEALERASRGAQAVRPAGHDRPARRPVRRGPGVHPGRDSWGPRHTGAGCR